MGRRRETRSAAPRGHHQRLRHRRDLPEVPRAARENAVAEVRAHFGDHANSILLLARYSVDTALKMDSFMRLIDWVFEFRDAAVDLPRPPKIERGSLTLKGTEASIDVGRIAENARDVHRAVQAQARLADTLTVFKDNFGQTEPLRDVDLMMGAAVVKYARERKLKVTHKELALVAVAVGIDLPGDDYRTNWSRWYKRMPKLARMARRVLNDFDDVTPFDDAKFFAPWPLAQRRNEIAGARSRSTRS
ncbi:hypothetical protein [Anaeromyxobacter sp. SG66]|uniref:hypothetical protein n=1 Tax=Anaeromyxobacter sp. SG66 TaxID=2925410 RepID=UPI001F58B235|nr:hypothetical protein [Anaeromyxobacter sp. SG66]